MSYRCCVGLHAVSCCEDVGLYAVHCCIVLCIFVARVSDYISYTYIVQCYILYSVVKV